MRILWVKANKILPMHSGGDIRSFNILRNLARQEQVIFFSYYDGSEDREYAAELEKQLPGSVCVCTGKQAESGWARRWDYLLRLPNSAPYAVSRFSSSVVQKRLQGCIAEQKPDVVICDFLDAAINFPDSLPVPAVLFQHNVESEIWRRHASNESGQLMKLVYGMEHRKMLRYERAAVRRFRHVIAVSDHDRKLMSAWVEPERITVVPTGVDIEQFGGSGAMDEEQQLVIFVGAMDWEPNVDGAKYFCEEVWPRVLAKVSQARFRIVGRNPDRRVQSLACDSVEVTGRVPSVVDHLRQAAVVVVPLRVGGGTRLKIYEAMAAGKAVVSTSVGAEGLDVHHGRDVLLADTPEMFADSIINLLQDAGMRHQFGRAAAELARSYGWPMIASKFGDVLKHVIGQRVSANATATVLADAVMQG